jgi:hypothetical protein
LENIVHGIRNVAGIYYDLSSSTIWLDQKSENSVRRHVEDVCRASSSEWEEYLPLVEFTYNNGYQESLNMIMFEVLYGRNCRVTISWDNPIDNITLRLELLKEKVYPMVKIIHNLKVS